MGRKLAGAATLSVTGADNTALFVIRDSGGSSTIEQLPLTGGAVAAPAAGETVYAVVVMPEAGTARPTLRAV